MIPHRMFPNTGPKKFDKPLSPRVFLALTQTKIIMDAFAEFNNEYKVISQDDATRELNSSKKSNSSSKNISSKIDNGKLLKILLENKKYEESAKIFIQWIRAKGDEKLTKALQEHLQGFYEFEVKI